MTKTVWAICAACTVAACAASPESIQPSPVDAEAYQGLTCEQLEQEHLRLRNALKTVSAQQRAARSDDTAGVILIGLPVGSMSGRDIAPQVARYKGELGAVQNVMIEKGCGQPVTLPTSTSQLLTAEREPTSGGVHAGDVRANAGLDGAPSAASGRAASERTATPMHQPADQTMK